MAYSLGSISSAMPSSSLPPVGARVVILYNRKQVPGTVRFAGITNFASGALVGVALDYPIGKNDGTVERVKYFECDAKHGLFVRPQAILSMLPPADINISQATFSPAKPKKSSKGSSKGRRSSGKHVQDESPRLSPQKDDLANQTIRPTFELQRPAGRGLNEFWEAIGGNVSQDVKQRADTWFDEQGAESLDDIIRYRLDEAFIEALQLKLVQRRKAAEFFENSGCGKEGDSISRDGSSRSGAKGFSSEKQNPRRSAVFADMLAPVLAPHGYTDAQVRDVVKQYEHEMAPLLQSPLGADLSDSGKTAKSVIPELLKSGSSCPDWLNVLSEIHSVVGRLAESAAAAEKQAIAATNAAVESELAATSLAGTPRKEQADGPTQSWLNEISERLDRVEENVQRSAEMANDAFGKFQERVRDAVRDGSEGNLDTPLKEMSTSFGRVKPGTASDDTQFGSPIVGMESFSSPTTSFPRSFAESSWASSKTGKSAPRSSPIHQGPLVISRNGGLLWRSFALHMDHLAYFAPAADSPQGLRLEGEIAFDDVKQLSLNQDSFVFFLPDGTMKLSTSGADERERKADIAQWSQAFGKALYFSVDASETKADLHSPDGQTVRKRVFRQPDSAKKISCRGHLGVVQHAPGVIPCITISKFFVLDGDSLEYFADEDDFKLHKEPVATLHLNNIVSVQCEEPEIAIYVTSSLNNSCLRLKLYAPERDQFQKWDDAWQSLLVESTWETVQGAPQTLSKDGKPHVDWSSACQFSSGARGHSVLQPSGDMNKLLSPRTQQSNSTPGESDHLRVNSVYNGAVRGRDGLHLLHGGAVPDVAFSLQFSNVSCSDFMRKPVLVHAFVAAVKKTIAREAGTDAGITGKDVLSMISISRSHIYLQAIIKPFDVVVGHVVFSTLSSSATLIPAIADAVLEVPGFAAITKGAVLVKMTDTLEGPDPSPTTAMDTSSSNVDNVEKISASGAAILVSCTVTMTNIFQSRLRADPVLIYQAIASLTASLSGAVAEGALPSDFLIITTVSTDAFMMRVVTNPVAASTAVQYSNSLRSAALPAAIGDAINKLPGLKPATAGVVAVGSVSNIGFLEATSLESISASEAQRPQGAIESSPLCQGFLGVRKSLSDSPQRQHCILYLDRMDVLSDDAMKPQWQVLVSTVGSVTVLRKNAGFLIEFQNGVADMVLMLGASDADMLSKWKDGWEKALAKEVIEQQPPTIKVLFQGSLEVLKKDRSAAHWRYFVLFEESISYYMTKEDWELGVPAKGQIKLDDILSMDVMDDCFNIKVREGTMSLRAQSSEEFGLWKSAWREVLMSDGSEEDEAATLGEARHKGVLGVIKRDGIRWQYFVLFDDCVLNYADVTEYDKGMICKGRVRYDDIVKFVVGEYALSIHIAGGKIHLQASGTSEFETWVVAWKKVLTAARPDLLIEDESKAQAPKIATEKPVEKVPEVPQNLGGSEDLGSKTKIDTPTNVSAKTEVASKEKLEATAPKDVEPELGKKVQDAQMSEPETKAGQVRFQGMLTRLAKNGPNTDMYFLLYDDRLEHFPSEEESKLGKAGGQIKIASISNLKLNENEFSFTVYVGTGKLTLVAGGKEDFSKWRSELEALVSVGGAAQSGSAQANILCQGKFQVIKNKEPLSLWFVLLPDVLEYYSSEEAFKSKSENAKQVLISGIDSVDVNTDSFVIRMGDSKKLVARIEDLGALKTWTSAWTQLGKHKPSGGKKDDTIKKGTLVIKRQMDEVSRYCVLTLDEFKYYASSEDYESGVDPRKVVRNDDVEDIERNDEVGFDLIIGDTTIKLRTSGADDYKAWDAAWSEIFQL